MALRTTPKKGKGREASMGKFTEDTENTNKRRRSANDFANEEFAAEEFAQPIDEHTAEEQERSRRTGDDSTSETRHDRNNQ